MSQNEILQKIIENLSGELAYVRQRDQQFFLAQESMGKEITMLSEVVSDLQKQLENQNKSTISLMDLLRENEKR